jgi:hypothetical protein
MAITRTAMVDDDGSGTTGTIINNAWKTEFYNQIDGAINAIGALGTWVPVAWDAGYFVSGSGGTTWTVTAAQLQQSFMKKDGKTYSWAITIAGSTIAGAVQELWIVRPFPEAIQFVPPLPVAWAFDSTGTFHAFMATHNADIIKIQRNDLLTFKPGVLHINMTVQAVVV